MRIDVLRVEVSAKIVAIDREILVTLVDIHRNATKENLWDHVAKLLQVRLSYLRSAKQRGYKIDNYVLWPFWLDYLCRSTNAVSLREIKKLLSPQGESNLEYCDYLEQLQEIF